MVSIIVNTLQIHTRPYEDFETLGELRGLVENVRAFAAYKAWKPLMRIKGHKMVL